MSLIRLKVYVTQEEYDQLLEGPPPANGEPAADTESARIRKKLGWSAHPEAPKEPKERVAPKPTPTRAG